MNEKKKITKLEIEIRTRRKRGREGKKIRNSGKERETNLVRKKGRRGRKRRRERGEDKTRVG